MATHKCRCNNPRSSLSSLIFFPNIIIQNIYVISYSGKLLANKFKPRMGCISYIVALLPGQVVWFFSSLLPLLSLVRHLRGFLIDLNAWSRKPLPNFFLGMEVLLELYPLRRICRLKKATLQAEEAELMVQRCRLQGVKVPSSGCRGAEFRNCSGRYN